MIDENKINQIMEMLRVAEGQLEESSMDGEDYGFIAGTIETLKNVLDILQG